jgi:hypothetical protein
LPSRSNARPTCPEVADPGTQEGATSRREHRCIVGFNKRERDRVERNDIDRRSRWRGDDAAIADIGVSKLEAGLSVIVLLRHHAVEADHASARMRDRRVPDAQAVAFVAKIRSHDVEAEEGEAIVVVDAGDGRDRLAVDLANEKAVRVGDRETGGVGEARIPALRRGPLDGDGDLLGAHIADLQIAHLSSRFRRWTFRPVRR